MNAAVYGSKTDALIKCNNNNDYDSCSVTGNTKSGYYINVGFEKSSFPIVMCNHTGCSPQKITETSCSENVGMVINYQSSLQLCVSNKDADTKSFTTESHNSFTLASIGDFPDSIRKVITVDINGDGSATLNDNTDGQLPICDNPSELNEKYCINRSKIEEIKSCNGGNCEVITGTDKTYDVYFFKEDDKLVIKNTNGNIANASEVKKAYECEFNDDANKSLKKCSVVDNGRNVLIDDAGLLTCYATTGCELETLSEGQIIYYLMKTNNCMNKYTVCEKEESKGYLYSCTKSQSVVQCKRINQVGYYINGNDLYTCSTDAEANNEIKCTRTIQSPVYSSCINNVGKIMFKDGKYVICTDSSTTAELSSAGNEYIIHYETSDKTYELKTNEYAFIKATMYSSLITKYEGNIFLTLKF